MKKITDEQFRKRVLYTLNKVSNTNIPVVITRKCEPSLIILSLKSLEAIEMIFSMLENPYEIYIEAKKAKNSKQSK